MGAHLGGSAIPIMQEESQREIRGSQIIYGSLELHMRLRFSLNKMDWSVRNIRNIFKGI